ENREKRPSPLSCETPGRAKSELRALRDLRGSRVFVSFVVTVRNQEVKHDRGLAPYFWGGLRRFRRQRNPPHGAAVSPHRCPPAACRQGGPRSRRTAAR